MLPIVLIGTNLLRRKELFEMKKAKKSAPRSTGKHDHELGKRIRLRRVEQSISQAELGSQLGISFQ
jgi:hypothetical protein